MESDLKEIVNSLCSNAYNYLTTTLEFQNNKAYVSNTKDPSGGYYYIAIAIEDNSVTVKENDRLTFNCIINCVLDFSVLLNLIIIMILLWMKVEILNL